MTIGSVTTFEGSVTVPAHTASNDGVVKLTKAWTTSEMGRETRWLRLRWVYQYQLEQR
jgi:hypothetical protein